MDTKTDLKQPLLQKPLSVPQKKILYDQAFLATFAWASSNFFFGILSAHNFATSCLQFSGYLLFSLFLRIFQAWKSGNGLYTHLTHGNSQFLHAFLSAFIFYLLSLLTIYAAYYANLAHMNFGVIASCISLSTPLNCLFSYLFFGERLTQRMVFGTSVVFMGVVWIAWSKPETKVSEGRSSEEEAYRWIAIGIALSLGLINAVRTTHGKYLTQTYKYSPLDQSLDQGLITGLFLLAFFAYFLTFGNETFTLYDAYINFIASILRMVCSLVALNCMIKGLSGPTSAILQSNTVVQILMNIIFLGILPTVSQAFGSLITLLGVVLLILYR